MRWVAVSGPLSKFKVRCRDASARPEDGAAPALMLEYQKSHRRRAVLGPLEPVFLRHEENEQPPPCKHGQSSKRIADADKLPHRADNRR
jgi:hypothetical protein